MPSIKQTIDSDGRIFIIFETGKLTLSIRMQDVNPTLRQVNTTLLQVGADVLTDENIPVPFAYYEVADPGPPPGTQPTSTRITAKSIKFEATEFDNTVDKNAIGGNLTITFPAPPVASTPPVGGGTASKHMVHVPDLEIVVQCHAYPSHLDFILVKDLSNSDGKIDVLGLCNIWVRDPKACNPDDSSPLAISNSFNIIHLANTGLVLWPLALFPEAFIALDVAGCGRTLAVLSRPTADPAMHRNGLALLACPADEFLDNVSNVEQLYYLNHTLISGIWDKEQHDNPPVNASYIYFTDDDNSTDDGSHNSISLIPQYASRGGFKCIVVESGILASLRLLYAIMAWLGDIQELPKLGLHWNIDKGDKANTIAPCSLAKATDLIEDCVRHMQRAQADFLFLDGLSNVQPDDLTNSTPGAPLTKDSVTNLEWACASNYAMTELAKEYRDKLPTALMEASDVDNYLWHVLSRAVAGDCAFIVVKDYMQRHKIGNYYQDYYRLGFMPLELGWIGLIAKPPNGGMCDDKIFDSIESTTVDEIEYQLNMSLATGLPTSLETTVSDLNANGFTDEILDLIHSYETMRTTGNYPGSSSHQVPPQVSDGIRANLLQPILASLDSPVPDTYRQDYQRKQYRLVNDNGLYSFKLGIYAERYAPGGAEVSCKNDFTIRTTAQPLTVKVTPLPICAQYDRKEEAGAELNVCLVTAQQINDAIAEYKNNPPLKVIQAEQVDLDSQMDTTMDIVRITASSNAQTPGSVTMMFPLSNDIPVIPVPSPSGGSDPCTMTYIDLSAHKVLGLKVDVHAEDPSLPLGQDVIVSVQLTDCQPGIAQGQRHYPLVFDHDHTKAGIVPYRELALPALALDAALESARQFDFRHVINCTIRLANLPSGQRTIIELATIQALAQTPTAVTDIELTINGQQISFGRDVTLLPPGASRPIPDPSNPSGVKYIPVPGQDYLVWDGATCRVYDANNQLVVAHPLPSKSPEIKVGPTTLNTVAYTATSTGWPTARFHRGPFGDSIPFFNVVLPPGPVANNAVIVVHIEEGDEPEIAPPVLADWETAYTGPDGTQVQINGRGQVRVLLPEQPDGPGTPMVLPVTLSPSQRDTLAALATGAAAIVSADGSARQPHERDLAEVLRTMVPELARFVKG